MMTDLVKWRTVFLLAAALAIGALWSQGRLADFLHPRNASLLPWCALALLAMGLVDLQGWPSIHGVSRIGLRHVAWFAPFVVWMVLRPVSLSENYARSRGLSAVTRMLAQSEPSPTWSDSTDGIVPDLPDSVVEEVVQPTPDDSDWQAPLKSAKSLPGLPQIVPATPAEPPKPTGRASIWCEHPAPSGRACVDTIRERFWYEQMLALYMDPSRHVGRKVRMLGLVQPDTLFGTGWFHVGRMMIWCCAADASPIGFYSRPAPGQKVPASGWVFVSGTLSSREGVLPGSERSRPTPILLDAVFEPAAAPAQANVVPFSY